MDAESLPADRNVRIFWHRKSQNFSGIQKNADGLLRKESSTSKNWRPWTLVRHGNSFLILYMKKKK
jgi:hypothetical protein